MNIEQIKTRYNERLEKAKSKEEQLQGIADKAKSQSERYARLMAKKMMEYHKKSQAAWEARRAVHWHDMLKEILQEVTERTGIAWEDVNLHTFGLECETPVRSRTEKGKKPLLLFFYPSFNDENDILVWNGQTEHIYPEGSIAAMNSGNLVKVKVSSIEMLIDLINDDLEHNK